MDVLIASLSITAMMGTASAATSLINGLYSLRERVTNSSDTGVTDIRRLIESHDLKNKITIMAMFIKEIELDKMKNQSIKMSIDSIHDAIKEIERELQNIQYRIDYNDNIYFGMGGFRLYRFNNSYKRLESKIKILNTRYDTLKTLFSLKDLMINNDQGNLNMIESENVKRLEDFDVDNDNKIMNNILTHNC